LDINSITYEINGAVFEVNRALGPGFLEKVYESGLNRQFQKSEGSDQKNGPELR
jgi:GxxExxY protein